MRAASASDRVDASWTLFHWALAGMVLTYVWRVHDLLPGLGRFKLTALVSLAALGLALVQAPRGSAARLGHPVVRRAAVILGLALLSVPGGVYPGHTFRFVYQDHAKTVLLMLLVVAAARSARDVERFLAVHVVGAVLYCLTVLTRYDVGADGRLGGLVYYDANDLAMLLVCTFPMAVLLARPGRGWMARGAAVAAMGLFAVTILRTGSRGGMVGLATVFAVMLVAFEAVPRAQRIGAVGAAVALLAFGASDAFRERMASLMNPSQDYNWSGKSSSGRAAVWTRGVGYMLEHPVLGVGAAAFPVAEGRLSPLAGQQELGRGLKWSAAHNSFVQIGAELGFPGLAAFLLLLGAGFRAARAAGRARAPDGTPLPSAAVGQALFATLVGYCVSGFFLSQAYSAFLYTVLALAAGLATVSVAAAAPVLVPATPRRPLGRGGLVVGALPRESSVV